MTRLKAILKVWFHVARRNSAGGGATHLRVSRGDTYDFEVLLVEDHTPEHERGEW